MAQLSLALLICHLLATSVAALHSGFCYGDRWDMGTAKKYSDFKRAFESAQQLPGIPASVDSARLFTSIQYTTTNTPIEAFQAALDTKTHLFLGIWLPSIDNELIALDAAFKAHGKDLAGLVVGISVGNEDLYRASDICDRSSKGYNDCDPLGNVNNGTISSALDKVRKHIAASDYKDWLKDIPIGHVDTFQFNALDQADFVGLNIYPYYGSNAASIDQANGAMTGSIEQVKDRVNGKDIWITETGWPASGDSNGVAKTGTDEAQKYWKDVGCPLFEKYNVYWFELERDTWSGNLDWGVIDIKSRKPQFNDFSCPGQPGRNGSAPTSSSAPSGTPPASSSAPSATSTSPPGVSSSSPSAVSSSSPPAASSSSPPPPSNAPSAAPPSSPASTSSVTTPPASSTAPPQSSSAPKSSTPPTTSQPPPSSATSSAQSTIGKTKTATQIECVTVYADSNGQPTSTNTVTLTGDATACEDPSAPASTAPSKSGSNPPPAASTQAPSASKSASVPRAPLPNNAVSSLPAYGMPPSLPSSSASKPVAVSNASSAAQQPSANSSGAKPSGTGTGLGGFTWPTKAAKVVRRFLSEPTPTQQPSAKRTSAKTSGTGLGGFKWPTKMAGAARVVRRWWVG